MGNALAKAVIEVGKGGIGWSLEEIEAAEGAKLGVIAQSSGKLTVRADLNQVD